LHTNRISANALQILISNPIFAGIERRPSKAGAGGLDGCRTAPGNIVPGLPEKRWQDLPVLEQRYFKIVYLTVLELFAWHDSRLESGLLYQG
jgi:hypothetical protein